MRPGVYCGGCGRRVSSRKSPDFGFQSATPPWLSPGPTEITALRSYFALQAFCCEAGDFGPDLYPNPPIPAPLILGPDLKSYCHIVVFFDLTFTLHIVASTRGEPGQGQIVSEMDAVWNTFASWIHRASEVCDGRTAQKQCLSRLVMRLQSW